jgi:hypothetical protein
MIWLLCRKFLLSSKNYIFGKNLDILLKKVFLLASKNMISREKISIRHETELAYQFAELVAQDTRLKDFEVIRRLQKDEAKLSLDGKTYQFDLHYLLVPSIAEIPNVELGAKSQPLLVVPKVSELFLDACRQKEVSVADLNGRIYLRGRGLLVSLSRLPGRNFRFELEPRNVFVGKSVRIVRSLLSDSEKLWRQSELVERTGATSGLVSRIVTHLLRQGMLRKVDARRFHLASPLALLDGWVEADDFSRRVTTQRYTALESDPVRLAKAVRNTLTHGGPHFAFTQWIAAWLRHPFTEPPVVSLYVPQIPPREILERIGLRPVNEAGRVWFHVPTDEGVFRERRFVDDLPIVSDAQIYLDLQDTGLRGPEQAQALREWSGFCRP